jgi:hypothetical protein
VDVLCDSSSESSPQNGHDDIDILSHTQPPNFTQLSNPIQPPQEKRKKQVATFMQIKGKNRGTKPKLIHEFSPISDVVELKRPPSSNSSIRNVMERVCTLEGVEEGSFLYRIATHIFHNEQKREMFVVIEKPHLQLIFLKGEAKLLRRSCSIRLASG